MMNQTFFELRFTIPNDEDFASYISEGMSHAFKYLFDDKGFEMSVNMVIFELLENVFYHNKWEETSIQPMLKVSMPPEKNILIFQTSNPIEKGGEHHQAVLDSLHRLKNAKSPIDAGAERLVENTMDPDGHSRLGFYQIAGGGLCQIEAHVDDASILHVFATMRIQDFITYREQLTTL